MGLFAVNFFLPRLRQYACAAAFASLGLSGVIGLETPRHRGVTIRGMVFDSLAMRPAANAMVWIRGSTLITTADNNGRFELRDVERGNHFLGFTAPAIDSLGLGELGISVNVDDADVNSARLGTPSFATLWRGLCKNQKITKGDSGILWGTVRDAATERRIDGAVTELRWSELQVTGRKDVGLVDRGQDIRTDSAGNYVACGVPLATTMTAVTGGERSMSGALQFVIGSQKVRRLDMMVSREMIPVEKMSAAAADSAGRGSRWKSPKGTSTIRGVVRDERGQPIREASVTLTAIDSALLTQPDGSFTATNLPAGTQQVEVRKIGLSPSLVVVHLRPATVTEVPIVVTTMTELKAVDVKAMAEASRDRTAFEERKKAGFGFALDGPDLAKQVHLDGALARLPNLIVGRHRGDLTLKSISQGKECKSPKVWIDNFPSSAQEASILKIDEVVAIEWYPRVINAPLRYTTGNPCAVILFWTVQSKWGTSR